MKKTALFTTVLIIIVMVLVCCDNQPIEKITPAPNTPTAPSSISDSLTEPSATIPLPSSTLTENENRIRAITDPVVMEYFGVDDLSFFDVRVDGSNANYELLIGDITAGIYSVECKDGKAGDIQILMGSEKCRHVLKNISLDDVEKAKKKLEEEGVKYECEPYLFYTINDGYFCLSSEFIVDNTPSEDDPIGHRHVVVYEKLCKVE